MNKVYKVIWNHSLNTFVVVSELARGYVKSSSSSNSSTSKLSKVFKLNLLGLLLAISLPSQAYIAIGSAENNYLNSNGADARPQNPNIDGGTYPLDYKNPGNKSYNDRNTPVDTNYSTNTSYGIAIGKYSSAIVSRADRRSNGIAIGDYSKATGGLSMALGSFSLATNVGSIALGTASRADGFNALSMMRQSAAIGDYSTAIGSVSWANGTASFALGASATAFGDQSIAIGSVSPTTSASASNSKRTKYDGLNRTQTNGNNSIAMGSAARTNGDNSFAIGSGAETGEFKSEYDSYLKENVTKADSAKSAQGAIAFGVNAKAKEAKAMAFGEEAKALKQNAMAFGAQANASERNAIAFGEQAKALKENAIAFGALANATESSSMAFGSKANALKQNAMAFGANAQASQQNAMAFGASAQASQQNAMAFGVQANASQENAMAFGASAQASQQNAMAFGTNAKATVTKAIAIGFSANAIQSNAVAIGSEANAIQSNTTAIGTTSKASQANSTALGFGAQATDADSVALGANSKTATKVATNSQNINGISHNFAGGNPIGTVSVGDSNKERTITNVGAGRISSTSTDAINGSQLYAVKVELEKGWTLNTGKENDGEVSGNSPAKVKLGETVTVKAGKNIKITQADKNITVATKDDVTFNKVDTQTLNVKGDTTVKNLTATGDTKVKNFTVDPNSTINMNNNRIMNVGDPTEATDAVNKKYVDNVEFNYKGDSGTGKNKLSTQTAFKGTANEIVTVATNGSVTFSLAKDVKDSLALAKSAVQSFTVGVGSSTPNIPVDKTNKHFDIVGTNNYVITSINDRKVKVDLADTVKKTITDVTNNSITVTGGDTQAHSFRVSDGGSIKVISNPSDTTNIITVGADTVKKAITVGVNSNNLNTFITNNPQVQANKNKIAALEPKVESNTNRINALEPRVQNTEKEITALKPQVTNNKNEIDALKPQVTNNKNEIDALKPQVETNKQDIADLKPQVESNKAEIDTLKPKVDKNTADIAAGWELQANGTKIKDVNPNDRIANFTQGQNIEISVENNSIKVSTSLTPKFTNATFGDNSDKTVIDKDGITITNNGKSPVKLNDNGLDNGGNKIQNLANGTSPNDAVNMSQLDAVNATANSGWKLQVNKEPDSESKVTPNATVSLNNDDGNIQITKTKNDNNVTFALNTTLTLGKEGNNPDGKDGSLTVKGKDGSAVALNGKDGSISLTGQADPSGTIKPTTNITVKNGLPDVTNAGNKTRITYTNGTSEEEVATLNDGLKFKGDNDPIIKKKLNEQLDIVGGATGDISSNNIAVRTSADGSKLEIKLAKSLTDLTNAEFGSGNDKTNINKDGITISNVDPAKNVSLTDTGLNNGGNKISNIANGVADGDAVNMSQLNAVNATANAGWTLFTNNNDATKSIIKPNSTVSLNNKDGNIQITKTQNDGNVTFALNPTLNLGSNDPNGNDGLLTVKGKNGSSVALNGADGSIGLAGPAGKPSTTIKVIEGKGGVGDADTVKKNRITYTNGAGNSEEVATLNDGLKFKGDTGTEIVKKLNETLTIKGNMATTDEVTDKNLRVDNDNGNLILKMAKSLKDLANATFGTDGDKTSIDKDGITITNNGKTISLTDDGLNNGDKQITNVASGLGNKTLNNLGGNDKELKNAANISDLKNAIDSVTNVGTNGGFGFIDSDNKEVKQNLGTTVKVQGKDGINAKVVDIANDKKALEFSLNSTVSIGKPNEAGKLTIKGDNGLDRITLNGKDGSIGLAGKDGVSTNISVANGPNTLDGQPNTNTTPRITYTNNGQTEHVATTNDGLILGANAGNEHKAKLNTKVNIKGDVANTEWSNFDQGKNLMTKVDTPTGLITIALAKNLTELTSATFKDDTNPANTSTLNGKGLTITPADNKQTVSLTDAGLNNGGNKITNVGSGLGNQTLDTATGDTLKNAVNVQDLKNAINKTVGDSGWNLKVNTQDSVKVGHNDTVEFIDGDNINITHNDKKITIATTKDLNVNTLKAGKKADGTGAGNDGSVTAVGANGSSVALNGKDGSINVINKDVGGSSASINVKQGSPDVSGQPNATKTRLTYQPVNDDGTHNGQPEEVATLKDGLKFKGDVGDSIAKQLNDTLTIKGNVSTSAEVTDKNLRVDSIGNELILKMAKSLQDLKDATFGSGTDKAVLTKDGLTITNNGSTVKLTENGLDNGGHQVTNVGSGLLKKADGSSVALKDAANDMLKNAANIGDLQNAVKDLTGTDKGGFGLKDETGGEVKQELGKSIAIKGDESLVTKVNATDKSLEISLNNKITVGDATNPGSVTIKGNNDKDAITLNGQDGTIKLKDTAGTERVSLNGNDGSIGLTGKDGTNGTLTFAKGDSHIDGTVGAKDTARISYTPNGSTTPEFVATLNDGLKFGANKGDIYKAKLNSQIDVKGDANNKDWTKFDAGKNIMTSINGGTITVGLAKALTDLESVTFNKDKNGGTPTATTKIDSNGLTITPTGNNVPDKTVSLTDKGLNNGGNKITNVASGLDGANLSTANGDTLNNAANIGDLKNALNNLTDNGFGLKDQDGKEFKQKLGETAQVKGDGSIFTKVVDSDNGTKALQVGLNKDITVGNATEAGTVTVKGDAGKDAISLNGKDGKIAVKKDDGKDAVSLNKDGTIGIDGADGASASLTMKNGPADLEGKKVNNQNPRLSYTPKDSKDPEFVATLNDGLKFGANTGTVRNAKLNSQIDVKGDANNADWAKFDAGKNIMTSINGGTITVGLAKALTDLESITFNKNTNGNPTATAKIDSNGLTITPTDNSKKPVSLTDAGLNNGGNKITNIAEGEVSANSKDAVNGSQLHEVKETANAGWNLSVNSNKDNNTSNVKPKQTLELNNSDSNIIITKTIEDDKHKVDFKLGDNLSVKDSLTVGPKNTDGKPTEGAVIIGKDGRDGKNNDNTIALVGKDGKDAVSIKGKDGVGTIGLTGAVGNDGTNTSAELSIAEGAKGLDGNDRQNGNNKTRIVYKKPDNTTEEVATLNDGLIFAGNDGTLINRKLNYQLNILGGITEKTDLTDKNKVSSDNLGVRWKSEDSLEIVMKERPTFSGLVLNGKDGQPANIKFEGKDGVPGMSLEGTTKDGDPALTLKNKDGQDGVTFTNDGRITNVADGKDGKDAVNMSQLNKVKEDLVNKGFGITAEDGNSVKKSLGETVDIVGADKNISTKVADGKVKIELAKNIDLGDAGSVKIGETTVNKDGVKIGDKVALTKDGLKVGDKVNITEDGVTVGDVNITEAGIDAGSKKVTNVADGDISADSKEAVNGSQLFKEAAKAKTEVEAGENIVVTPRDGDNGQKIYTVATKKDVSFDNVKVGDIAINKDSGINAGDKKITNVANGEIGKGSKDAVNGDQLFTEAAKAKSEVKAGTNVASVTTGTGDKGQTIYTVNADGASVSAGSDKVTVTKGTKDANNVTDYKVDLAQATKDDIAKGVDAKAQVDKGINFAGDDGKSTNYKLGDTVTISGDSNLTTETTDKGVTVKLNKDINLNSVSANTFKAGGVTISADSGINAGGKQITHVASGLVDKNGNKIHIRNAAGDTLNNAVNVGDLKTVAGDIYNNIDTTNKRVDKLDKRVRGIGANSAAAASLPQVYIPGKSMVAASAGGYGGEAAVALGYSRASDNGKVILKLTGTANSAGHYSGGVGVGYQW